MTDEQVGRIERAIRDHTWAMVAATLFSDEYEAAFLQRRADDLLAALSASSGGENDAASGRAALPSVPGTPVAADSQAATPPLSADPRNPLSAEAASDAYGLNEYETVTVRRDGLDALLLWERASEMEARDRARERRAQALAVLRGIRKAVSR